MKKINLVLLIFASSIAPASYSAYPEDLFAVAQMRVNSVRQPHGWNWYLKSREAQAILTSVTTYMGVDPFYVKLALDAIPSAKIAGEETFYSLPVPSGYVFCAARISVISMAPGSGKRAAVINAGNRGDSLGVYTWTPVRHFGEGRAWVDADVQVTGIKEQYVQEFRNKGVCREPTSDNGYILDCRGHCSGVEWGRLQDAGSTTSDLTKGF